jgi:hypothetical protein
MLNQVRHGFCRGLIPFGLKKQNRQSEGAPAGKGEAE